MKRILVGILIAVVVSAGLAVVAQAQQQDDSRLTAKIDALEKDIQMINGKCDSIIQTQQNIIEELRKVIIRVHRS